jgi:hypothetical protein
MKDHGGEVRGLLTTKRDQRIFGFVVFVGRVVVVGVGASGPSGEAGVSGTSNFGSGSLTGTLTGPTFYI